MNNNEVQLTETESKFYKKFKNLSVNEEPMPQGEGSIRISPFDDYFIFTIYDEIDGVNTPIDLSNVGTINMVFVSENDEIRIPNYTNVQDVDLSSGQVLFRISKSQSRKILALKNKNFYISTVMIDPDGTSDETVIYTGMFLSFEESAKTSFFQELEKTKLLYTKELAAMQGKLEELNADIAKKDSLIIEQAAIISALGENNEALSNEISVLGELIPSDKITALLNTSKDIQKTEEDAKINRQQINALKESRVVEQTKSKKKAFFMQAAEQLRSNLPGANVGNKKLILSNTSNITTNNQTGLL